MRLIFGQRVPLLPNCRIDLVDGALAVTTPYSLVFVNELKALIPPGDRKWDPDSKRWMVSAAYGSKVARMIGDHFFVPVSLPDVSAAPAIEEMLLLDIRYIGATKLRDDGSETASGWSQGKWCVIFPKAVLFSWFGQTAKPDEARTLYGVLGITQDATPADLKAAWKRLARTWHPDVSREPGSREQFQAIQHAYGILGDQTMRAKYNAGLALAGMNKAHTKNEDPQFIGMTWYCPLRCGLVLVNGQRQLGGFLVSKILQWADITDASGRILVTSWAAGDDKFTESWVMP